MPDDSAYNRALLEQMAECHKQLVAIDERAKQIRRGLSMFVFLFLPVSLAALICLFYGGVPIFIPASPLP